MRVLEVLCHIVFLVNLIFWFFMWRVCLRIFCHVFIIYKMLFYCDIFCTKCCSKTFNASILLCIHFNHSLYMRGSRNFSRSPRPIFGNFTICVYKKFKEPPPHSRSAHANMNGNAIPAWIGEMLKDNGQNPLLPPPLSLSLGFIFVYVHPKVKYIYMLSLLATCLKKTISK